MKRCVLLCRCSTDKEKGLQDYTYQVNTLTEICKQREWEIVKVFGNYVSGAAPIESRQEIQDLIAFVKENNVDYCCATEISRVSRDLITGVQIIRTLAENGVNLFLANYNLFSLDENKRISAATSLILTISLEVSSLERQLIRTRLAMGYQTYLQRRKTENLPLGRPQYSKKTKEQYLKDYPREVTLLRKNLSLRNVSKITGTAIGTIRRIKACL